MLLNKLSGGVGGKDVPRRLSRGPCALVAAPLKADSACRGYRNVSTATTAKPVTTASREVADKVTDKQKLGLLEDLRDFLAKDIVKLMYTGQITKERYDKNVKFEDPISLYPNMAGYLFNVRLLRTLFDVDFKLHSCEITGNDEITARWTMKMVFKLAPWRPNLVFTGVTLYKVNTDTGKVTAHIDLWDAVDKNSFPSLEGFQYLLKMLFQVQLTPNIESPEFIVLRKFQEYEIRKYSNFFVAETNMPKGQGPASGTGFTDLANYIFGGNRESEKMEMTTPVLTTVEPGKENVSMSFVMEKKYNDLSKLPTPKDGNIQRKEQQLGYVAAVAFSGWPLEYEVVENERKLRDALLRDGYKPRAGYQLLRYNEPTVPPFWRRNEVVIALDDFQWPQL